MNLEGYREKLDEIDAALSGLFCRRMALSEEIARLKAADGLPVYHAQREKQVTDRLTGMNDPAFENELKALYRTIFELSRARQEAIIKAIAAGEGTV